MDAIRLHVLDTLAAWIAATKTAEGKAVISFRDGLRAFDNRTAKESALLDDVAARCALARLSEIDDIHLGSMTTPGSIVIPAALTIASGPRDIDAGDVTAAILAGYEAMIRLGLAIKGAELLAKGIWPTYFMAPFAVAATVARLLRLNETETAHALALALTLAAPSVGQYRAATAARWLSIGHAARSGLTAALAARAGFTGDIAFLESRGFTDIFGIAPTLAEMTAPRADAFLLAEVSFKPWWGARQTMAATQGLRELRDDGVDISDAGEIAAFVPPPHVKMVDHGVIAGDRTSYLTSLPYQMARAVLRPDLMLDIGPSAPLHSDAMKSLMTRITVRADERLLAHYPKSWPARVTVTTTKGTAERFVHSIPGDPDPSFAFTQADVNRKFDALVAPVMGEVETRRLWDAGNAAFASGGTVAAMHDLNRILTQTSETALKD